MISYAPDDGQAIKFCLEPCPLKVREGEIKVSVKVLKKDQQTPRTRSDWEWISFPVNLPDIAEVVDGRQLASPELRLDIIGGKLIPVMDLKIKVKEGEATESKNFLTVDWGVRKLLTICAFSENGEQISRPFFLKCGAIQDKLFRIRTEISFLKSKRHSFPKGATKAKWYNREIAKKWNKFSSIQKQLSHLASNVIVEIAKVYNCSKIYVEWLGSLKSKNKDRNKNWKINSQVRQQIYQKVGYKAKLAGISLQTINPSWTSQFCPKCGKRGYHVKASDRLNERKKIGGWFYCPECGYNADRDYVACQNIARKALYGDKLRCMSKAFVYNAKAISDKLFRQSISAMERLRHNLNGWKKVVFLRPVYLVTGTLRL